MVKDVGDREVVGEGGIDQGDGGAGDGNKAADPGSSCGLSQSVWRDAAAVPGGQLAQSDAAGQQRIAAQNRELGEEKSFQIPA